MYSTNAPSLGSEARSVDVSSSGSGSALPQGSDVSGVTGRGGSGSGSGRGSGSGVNDSANLELPKNCK